MDAGDKVKVLKNHLKTEENSSFKILVDSPFFNVLLEKAVETSIPLIFNCPE